MRTLAAHLGVRPERVKTLRQVHGTGILRRSIRETVGRLPPTGDAHWTTDPSLVLLVFVADCCPVVLADPRSGIFGIAHAGWRGAAAEIVPSLWKELVRGGADGESIHGWIGPCAGSDRYEIGPEVAERFVRYPGALRKHREEKDRILLDIRVALKHQLRHCGLDDSRLSLSRADTIGDRAYHSHRRDRIRAGRMPAYVTGSARPDGR